MDEKIFDMKICNILKNNVFKFLRQNLPIFRHRFFMESFTFTFFLCLSLYYQTYINLTIKIPPLRFRYLLKIMKNYRSD